MVFQVKKHLHRDNVPLPLGTGEQKKNIHIDIYLKVGTDFSLCKTMDFYQIHNANLTRTTPGAVNLILL